MQRYYYDLYAINLTQNVIMFAKRLASLPMATTPTFPQAFFFWRLAAEFISALNRSCFGCELRFLKCLRQALAPTLQPLGSSLELVDPPLTFLLHVSLPDDDDALANVFRLLAVVEEKFLKIFYSVLSLVLNTPSPASFHTGGSLNSSPRHLTMHNLVTLFAA